MPMIRVEMFPCGAEKKKELMQVLTNETERIIGCPKQAVQVVVIERNPDDWSIGGQVMSERHKKG